MAGYVIHLAVGEEYLRKHPNEIKSYDEFIQGIIAPDDVKDKSLTHYGPKSSKVNLKNFFEEKDIDSDFNKGYFIHLLTDYIFYNHFLQFFSKSIYEDYDILNNYLIEKYDVKIPKKVENKVFYKEGLLHILSLDTLEFFINKVSNYDIDIVKEEVLKGIPYWFEIKKLKKI